MLDLRRCLWVKLQYSAWELKSAAFCREKYLVDKNFESRVQLFKCSRFSFEGDEGREKVNKM